MVEIEESNMKWGQGFIENIDTVLDEFIKYRGLRPLNVLFICKDNKGLVMNVIRNICQEMGIKFFNKKVAILESEKWECMEEGELRDKYQEINTRREEYLEEREQLKSNKETRKKKKNDPKVNNQEDKGKGLISNEEMKEIMRLSIKDDIGMYVKGVMMMDVCDHIEQFSKLYEEGFLKGISYIIEFTTSTMSIKDSEKKISKVERGVVMSR